MSASGYEIIFRGTCFSKRSGRGVRQAGGGGGRGGGGAGERKLAGAVRGWIEKMI